MEKEISNIIQKYVQGTSTKEELKRALCMLEDPYHNLELRPTLYDLWHKDFMDEFDVPEPGDFSGMLNEIHHKINLEKKTQKKSKAKRFLISFSRIAAIMVIGGLIGIITQKYKKRETVYYTSIAPLGSVSQMVLPDNTMVYLNAGTEIKYSIQGVEGKREVFLKGEAWFQVEKNEEKPFVVHTSYYDVNVLGTEFNVQAYPEDDKVTTTLEKGSVKITSTDNFKIQSNQVLKPGEQLVYNKQNNVIRLKEVNTKQFTAWKENKLIFINMSLKELIILLERKYGVDIEVDDKSILEFHYDGTLKNETILEVMEILQETLPINFKIKNSVIKYN